MGIEPAADAVDLTLQDDPNMQDDDAPAEQPVEAEVATESEGTAKVATEPTAPAEEAKPTAPAEEETPPEEKPEEENPDEAKVPANLEEVSAKLKEAMKDLSPEQKARLLGAESKEFAAIHAKKKRLREWHEEVTALQKEVEATRENVQKTAEGFEAVLKTARNDPKKALEVMGWTVPEFLDYLNGGERVPEGKRMSFEQQEAADRAARLEAENRKLQQKMQRAEAERAEQEWTAQVRSDSSQALKSGNIPHVARYLSNQPAEVAAQMVAQEVWNLQRTAYEKHGRTLPTSEALGILEAHVARQAERFGAGQAPTPAPRTGGASETPRTEGTTEPNTLSGNMSSQRSLAPSPPGDDWDDDFDPIVDEEKKRLASIQAALGRHR